MLAPGTVVDGRFEIVELLGEGGMGTVYAARHKSMDRTIALKLLKASLVRDEDKVARFRNEARVLSSLQHPNIIAIHAVGVADTGQPYMAMDILSGENISDAIKRRGPFTQDEALRICIEICKGLHYAHGNQIIHRDIKPSNIILSTAETGATVPKLVDFGIAKVLDGGSCQQLTQTGMAIGSVFYLSPGQLEGRAADPASDIYALGCTLYEMLTGVPPFEADNFFQAALSHKNDAVIPICERNPHAKVDDAVEQIVACMLAKEHHARYQSAEELQHDLTAALQGTSPKHASKLPTLRLTRPRAASSSSPMKRVAFWALTVCVATSALLVMLASKPNDSNLRSEVNTLLAEASAHGDIDIDNLSKAHETYGRIFVQVTKKADDTHDPLLMAQAWRLRAQYLDHLLTAEKVVLPAFKDVITWDLKAYNIANRAVEAGGLRPDQLRILKRERFLAYSGFLVTYLCVQGTPTQAQYETFISCLDSSDPSTDKDYKSWCADTFDGVAKRAIRDKDARACLNALTTRRVLLDSLGTERFMRVEEFEKLMPSLRVNLGESFALTAKKVYED